MQLVIWPAFCKATDIRKRNVGQMQANYAQTVKHQSLVHLPIMIDLMYMYS